MTRPSRHGRYNRSMLHATEKIWHNGRLIQWNDAKIHVLSHVVSYGSSVFEGIRCYETKQGPAIFRAQDHMRRLLDSAKIYRIDVPYSVEQLTDGMVDLMRHSKLSACYVRPIVLRGYGGLGVLPKNNPIETYMACYPWGRYLGEEAVNDGVDVCISSWNRLAPNTLPALAKAGANYMNSQLIRMEAEANGYDEGIALDSAGLCKRGFWRKHFRHSGRQDRDTPAGRFCVAGNHARYSDEDRCPARIFRNRSAGSEGNALHRRRSFLYGHCRRSDARPVS